MIPQVFGKMEIFAIEAWKALPINTLGEWSVRFFT